MIPHGLNPLECLPAEITGGRVELGLVCPLVDEQVVPLGEGPLAHTALIVAATGGPGDGGGGGGLGHAGAAAGGGAGLAVQRVHGKHVGVN